MIKTEKQLWLKLKKEFKNSHIKLTRIESSTVSGIPDIAFTDGKINGWVGLKVLNSITKNSKLALSYKNLKLTVAQITWFTNHPNSWVLISHKDRICLFNLKEYRDSYSAGWRLTDLLWIYSLERSSIPLGNLIEERITRRF